MEEPVESTPPAWRPLSRRQRRIVGVLVEKAKTTPDQYPLTLNALTNGCNQKSNRSPEMSLAPEDVEEELEGLRAIEAVIEVHGGGRAAKFKHRMYEWLGVNKYELAIMAELLLRGEQTLGDLRGRANRMERIESVATLKPMVEGLMERGLVIALTPPGRGQIVTHALYQPDELERLQKHVAENPSVPKASPRGSGSTAVTPEMWEQLQAELTEIRAELQALRQRVDPQ